MLKEFFVLLLLQLLQASRRIGDLFEDLRSGNNLISLLEVLSGEHLVSCWHRNLYLTTNLHLHIPMCVCKTIDCQEKKEWEEKNVHVNKASSFPTQWLVVQLEEKWEIIDGRCCKRGTQHMMQIVTKFSSHKTGKRSPDIDHCFLFLSFQWSTASRKGTDASPHASKCTDCAQFPQIPEGEKRCIWESIYVEKWGQKVLLLSPFVLPTGYSRNPNPDAALPALLQLSLTHITDYKTQNNTAQETDTHSHSHVPPPVQYFVMQIGTPFVSLYSVSLPPPPFRSNW